jgi:Uma2 family endonuclease
MATVLAIPFEEYLRTSFRPDCDYIDGQVVERHVGEYFHARMQGLIYFELQKRAKSSFRVFPELRVRVGVERCRIPDVCVKALPHEIQPVLESPDIAIEVMSPDDSFPEMLERVADYLKAGVPQIWIVNPYKREAHVADLEGVRKQDVVENPLIGSISFIELFSQLDQVTD